MKRDLVMKFPELIKRIKQNTWWSEEAPSNFQFAFAAWHGFLWQSRTYGPRALSICIVLYRNDFCYEKTSEQEKLAQFQKVRKQFLQDPKIIQSQFHKFQTALQNLHAVAKTDMPLLVKRYQALYDAYDTLVVNAVMPESADVYSDQLLLPELEKEAGGEYALRELSDIAVVLSQPARLSFMERCRIDILKAAISGRQNWPVLVERWSWVENNYLSAKKLTSKYFERECRKIREQKTLAQINAELKSLKAKPARQRRKQRHILQKVHLSQKMRRTFELLRLIGEWIDLRKAGMLQAVGYVDRALAVIAAKTGIDEVALGFYTPEEIVSLLLENKKISNKVIRERRRLSVYVHTRTSAGFKQAIYYGAQAQKVFTQFQARNTNAIKGFVASKPAEEFTGKVQILLNPHKQRFIPGRILVTTMTRPDFVPAMRQAAAIVTDEGGITSHAAIVSREMGIPCIIGTKIATKFLKSGNWVKLDLSSGEVKLIR